MADTTDRNAHSSDTEVGNKSDMDPNSNSDIEAKAQSPDEKVSEDPNIVGWDGPNDPQNPMNFSSRMRFGHVIMVSVITLIV